MKRNRKVCDEGQQPKKAARRTPTKKKAKAQPLDLAICPSHLQEAYSANTRCRLFSLPAEILLRIFEFVIQDSRCIEVGYANPGDLLPSSIPLRSPGIIIIPCAEIKGLYLTHRADYEVYPRPHEAASQWTTIEKIESSEFHPLNRICRQVYHESMIMPYRLHTFAFGNLSALKAWVTSLSPSQKATVRSIFYADFAPEDIATIADVTLIQLPGLRRLYLPRRFKTSKAADILQWLQSLRQKDLNLRFLERPDHINRYVKVSI
jgi:hypothetical protein